MSVWTGLVVWCVELVAIAALATSRRRARVCLVAALLLLALPAFVTAWPLIAMNVLMVGLLFCALRTADFAFDGPIHGFGARFVHLIAIVDTRCVVRCPRRFDGRALARLLVALAAVVIAIWLIRVGSSLEGWRRPALRWFAGGLVMAPAGFAVVNACLALFGKAFGLAIPPICDAPLLSRSLNEFWAMRWNRVVSKILRERFYRPLSRHGTTAALFAAFGASALLHAWLIGIQLDTTAAAMWALFFLVQPIFILAERRLRVRQWRSVWGWLWTLSILTLLSPLFTEPLLRWLEMF
jgi:hypothetical protein